MLFPYTLDVTLDTITFQNLYFITARWKFFPVFVGHLFSLFGELPASLLCLLPIGLSFKNLICRSPLHLLGTDPSPVQARNISPHLVTCFSTLFLFFPPVAVEVIYSYKTLHNTSWGIAGIQQTAAVTIANTSWALPLGAARLGWGRVSEPGKKWEREEALKSSVVRRMMFVMQYLQKSEQIQKIHDKLNTNIFFLYIKTGLVNHPGAWG